MTIAGEQATKGVFPFGAVLVRNNEVLVQAAAGPVTTVDPTDHAEIAVIRLAGVQACSGATLYTSCEPCPMCFTAAWFAGISKIVYGASLENAVTVFGSQIRIGAEEMNERGGNRMEIVGGCMQDEMFALMKAHPAALK